MRAATDVGGTFTDLVYFSTSGPDGLREIRTAKSDTTPPEFDRGVMEVLDKASVDPGELTFFAHGSTVIINALTERKGVKTALITTKGFRDVLEIARGTRPDLFNFNARKPKPFVERHLRVELDERTTFKGDVRRPVDLEPLPELLAYFKAEGVEAIAICFLHAYRNPENEKRALARIKTLWPEVSAIASHEISREWREYERTSTTVLSAFVHPVAKRYIERLERRLAEAGLKHPPYMMQSNGGIATAEAARRNPISMVESGPASGIYASAHFGRLIGEPNLIVLDIGGTTAKCALIEQGEIKITTDYAIEQDRKRAGYPIQTPVCEIVEIGNGGGSIAWVDEGGKLHVGPQSAGAMPGPAAYGRGGTKPTTTDANLLVGRIDPASFAGGAIAPDMAALAQAFRPVAERLGLSDRELARGIIRIANANMTNALRLVSTNKGYDPRDFTLIAFGGGGPMHCVELARELNIPKVIVPVHSAVFSALGMLLADLRRDYLLTVPTKLLPGAEATLAATLDQMRAQAIADCQADGSATAAAPAFAYLADLRYRGQEHAVTVPLSFTGDGTIDLAATIDRFHDAHERRYTYRLPNEVDLVNLRLVSTIAVDKPDLVEKPVTGLTLADALLGMREVDFDQKGIHATRIFDGPRLEPGMQLTGPAIVQEPSVTLVVPPGDLVSVDRYGNYHIELAGMGAV
jgi:N-methylhydantoinase A